MKAHPTHLYTLLFNERRLDQLESALQQTKARLEAEGEADLWQYWNGMRLAAQGDFSGAEAIVAALCGEHQSALKRTIALERARQAGDWAGLAAHFEAEWNATKSAEALLALCEAKLNAQQPEFIVQHARELITQVGTPEALRVATTAASRTRDWRTCLDLLDANIGLFPRSQLPADLRRLRVACEQNLGMLAEALRDAEALAADEKSLANLTLLFDLNVRSGHLHQAAVYAQGIVNLPEATPATLMRVGWFMRLEDPSLSKFALQKALEQGIDDPHQIGMANMLAQQLGVPDVASSLWDKFIKAAQAPDSGFTTLDYAGIVKMMLDRAQHSQESLRLFAGGGMPVHLLSESLGTPIAIWPVTALANRTRYAPGAVYFRHGGKQSDSDLTAPRKFDRVYVDITAYINAHELGLLPLVEQAFGTLIVPPALRSSLVQQLDHLTSSGNLNDRLRTEVLHLVDAGKITKWADDQADLPVVEWHKGLPDTWCRMVEEAARNKALVVDLWPKRLNDGTVWGAPTELQASLTHAGAVVGELQRLGRIDEATANAAIVLLAGDSTGVASHAPAVGQRLFLTAAMAQVFARARVLGPLAETFPLIMPDDEIGGLRQREHNEQDRAFVGTRVRMMLEYLGNSNRLTNLVLKSGIEPLGQDSGTDAAQYCLAELLQAETGENYWVWSDDRWLNGHQHVANLPVVSTAEVLTGLRQAKVLSEGDYFALRHRLRQANYRFMPVMADELVHELNRSQEQRGTMLVETPELMTLRKYFADCLAARDALQVPPVATGIPNSQGEVEFFLASIRAMHDAFVQIFTDSGAPNDLVKARATWLYYWMWAPAEHLGALLGKPVDERFASMKGGGESLFLARMLDAKAFGQPENIRRYGDWLGEQISPEPSRVEDIRRHMQRTLEQTAAKVEKETLADHAHRWVLNRWYFNLPDWLREHLEMSAKTRQRLRIRNSAVVGVGTAQFESDKFWSAAEAAFAGSPATVTAIGDKQEFDLMIQKNTNGPQVIMQMKGKEEKWGFQDPALGVIHPTVSRRQALLVSHPEWFDLQGKRLKQEAAKIAAVPDARNRLTDLDRLRARSLWLYYLQLAEKFNRREEVSAEAMEVPDVDDYAHYLRTESSSTAAVDWNHSAREMITAVKVEQAFIRLATLPMPLPDALLATLDGWPKARRSAMLGKLRKDVVSPLVRIQLFRLGLRYGDNAAAAEHLLSEGMKEDIAALIEIAQWNWNGLGRFGDKLSPVMRLAISWAHAGHLMEILLKASSSKDAIAFFHERRATFPAETIVRASGEEDIAFPRLTGPDLLLISAFGSAIAAEPEAGFQPTEMMRSQAQAMCVMPSAADLPKLEWLFDPATFTNLLGSFIGVQRESYLPLFTNERVATFVSSGELARQLEALLGSLETDPSGANAWIILGAIFRGRACPAPLKTRLEAVMRKTKIATLPADEKLRSATVLALAAQAAEVGGMALVEVWQDRIAELASWLRGLPNGAAEQESRHQMLIRCAVTLARHGPVRHPVGCFCQTMLKVCAAWPELSDNMAGTLQLLMRLPHPQLAEAWDLILAIRIRSSQKTEAAELAANSPS